MPPPDFTNDERFDGLYMNVANSARGIEPLLDTMFSFLRRKTDFFSGPEGQNTDAAVAKVNQVLQKHVQIHKEDKKKNEEAKKRKEQEAEKRMKKKREKETKEAFESASDGDGVIEMGDDNGFDISSSPQPTKGDSSTANEKDDSQKEISLPQDSNSAATITATTNDSEKKIENEDEEELGPPPAGNGGTVPGKYVWTQTLSELNVTISLPENTRGRDLKVTMKKKHLSVALKSQLPKHIVDAPLSETIICDDSFWTVEDGNRLVISLQKLNQMEWWSCLCVG